MFLVLLVCAIVGIARLATFFFAVVVVVLIDRMQPDPVDTDVPGASRLVRQAMYWALIVAIPVYAIEVATSLWN